MDVTDRGATEPSETRQFRMAAGARGSGTSGHAIRRQAADQLRNTDAVKTTKRARRWVVAAVVLTTLVVAGGAYAVLGWQRMETYCPSGADHHHSWEWNPVGFTCAAEDGSARSSLWWSRPFHLAE